MYLKLYLSIIRNLILRASPFRTKSFNTSFLKTIQKFKDDHLSDDHANLFKRYKSDLKLPSSPILPENHCSKKLLQLMFREDKVIWDLIETMKTNRPMGIHGAYMKILAKDLHMKDNLLFLDKKLVVPATIRGTFNTMLHETHPGQIEMKSLAEYLWWPHIYREIYHHGKTCSHCLKADKNLKTMLGTDNMAKLPTLTFANEEINLDFAGPLDAFWGKQKYILLCIDRFTKFPSAKNVSNTSANSVISFLNDLCHHHGFPRKIRVDHGSCFLSHDYTNFFKKFIIEIIYCTVGDHRSNGLVERLVYTIKSKLLAMSFELPKPALNSSIEKIIWNLRISKQASIGCTPFEKHFKGTAYTRWKNLISFNDHLDKGKSILSSRRASKKKENPSDMEDNITLAHTTPSPTTPESHKQPRGSGRKKKIVAGDKLYRRAINRKNGKTYFH